MKRLLLTALYCALVLTATYVAAEEETVNTEQPPVRASQEVQEAFNGIKDDVFKAYTDRHKVKQDLYGVIIYEITIAANGTVDAIVTDATLEDKELQSTLLNLLKTVKFGEAKEKMTLSFPINFPKEQWEKKSNT